MADTSIVIDPMSADEARATIDRIKVRMHDNRADALALKERRGWEALGYPSFAACVEAEFGRSFQQIYRQVNAAQIERVLKDSPAGELLPPRLPERHARELGKLGDPAAVVTAYADAHAMAQMEGADAPTSDHMRRAAETQAQRKEVLASPFFVIGHMMTRGEITPAVALEMTNHLNAIKKPRVRGQVIEIISRYGCTCSDLLPALAQMCDRPPGQESKTLQTLLTTGYLGNTPLRQANLTDLRDAKYEARGEHIVEKPPTYENVVVTVYPGKPERTLKQLARALSPQDLKALAALILEQV